MSEHQRLPRWFVITLLAMVACRGIVWSVASPVWRIPDEPAHASYAEQLRWQPDIFGGDVRHSKAVAETFKVAQPQAPSPGVLDSRILRDDRITIEHIDPHDGKKLTDFVVSAGGYPPFFYLLGAAVYQLVPAAGGSYLTILQGLRLLGATITVLAFVLQIRIVTRLLRDRFRSAVTLIVMASLPMVGFASTALNPDVLMAVWFSAALLIAMNIHDRGVTRWRVLGFVAVVAAAFLTKPTAAALLPLVALVALLARDGSGTRLSWVRRIGLLVAAGIGSLVPNRVFTHFDTPVNNASVLVGDSTHLFNLHSVVKYAHKIPGAFMGIYNPSFWGNYGWVDTPYPNPRIYAALGIGVLIAFIGVLYRVAVVRRVPTIWVLAITPVLTLLAMIFYLEFTLVLTNRGYFIQGRYLFPVLPAIFAGFVVGITSLRRWPWIGRGLALGVVAVALLLEVTSWVSVVLPRYSL